MDNEDKYNGFDPMEILTEEQRAAGYLITHNGKPIHPNKAANLAKPFSGTDDARWKEGQKTNAKKQALKRDRQRLEDELRSFKKDAISDARARVESGEVADAIKMLQDSLLEIDMLLTNATEEKLRNSLLDTKIKYINAYANLTIGSVGTTGIPEESEKEQVTQEDLDKKFAEFSGKFEVVHGGKK